MSLLCFFVNFHLKREFKIEFFEIFFAGQTIEKSIKK